MHICQDCKTVQTETKIVIKLVQLVSSTILFAYMIFVPFYHHIYNLDFNSKYLLFKLSAILVAILAYAVFIYDNYKQYKKIDITCLSCSSADLKKICLDTSKNMYSQDYLKSMDFLHVKKYQKELMKNISQSKIYIVLACLISITLAVIYYTTSFFVGIEDTLDVFKIIIFVAFFIPIFKLLLFSRELEKI